jgi:hypothetical protein
MKKLLSVLAFLAVVAALAAAEGTPESSMAKGQAAKENTMNALIRAVPVPELKNAQERMMIARRALMFDKPHVVGYVYIFISGASTPLGYYVVDGKVASLKSYLVPQQRITDEAVIQGNLTHVSGYYVVDDADIDGTYGDNIDGVFFFTDNGVYVEIPTNGPVGYTYSTQPLPIRVPKLTVQFAVPDKPQ